MAIAAAREVQRQSQRASARGLVEGVWAMEEREENKTSKESVGKSHK